MNFLTAIDFETGGLYDDAVCLSFGMTVSRYDAKDITFKELVDTGLYIEFDFVEQLKMGRKTQKSVLEWWKSDKVTPEAREAAWGTNRPRASIRDLPSLMKEYLTKMGVPFKEFDIYDRNCFDATKLQHIFEESLGEEVFWNYQNRYEVATALRWGGLDRYGNAPASTFEGAIHHHPLHDSAMDHRRILNAMHLQG